MVLHRSRSEEQVKPTSAYCRVCKTRVTFEGVTRKTGSRTYVHGTCPNCTRKVSKLLSSKEEVIYG